MTDETLKSADAEAVDQAFTRRELYATAHENTFSGVLSFMRRLYTKDLSGCDFAVTGVAFDCATTNRPGARFGPRAIRAASTNLAWGRPGRGDSIRSTGWRWPTAATAISTTAGRTPFRRPSRLTSTGSCGAVPGGAPSRRFATVSISTPATGT